MDSTILLGSVYIDGNPVYPTTRYNRNLHHTITLGDSDAAVMIPWVLVRGVLISTWNLITEISWDELFQQKLISGSTILVDGFKFVIRVPSANSPIRPGDPYPEWTTAMSIQDGDNVLWHWKGTGSWCQEWFPLGGRGILMGGTAAKAHQAIPSNTTENCGWRPVLVPIGEQMTFKTGTEVFLWGAGGCIRGRVKDITQYDILLEQPIGCSDRGDGLFSLTGDRQAVVDRERVDLVQIRYSKGSV